LNKLFSQVWSWHPSRYLTFKIVKWCMTELSPFVDVYSLLYNIRKVIPVHSTTRMISDLILNKNITQKWSTIQLQTLKTHKNINKEKIWKKLYSFLWWSEGTHFLSFSNPCHVYKVFAYIQELVCKFWYLIFGDFFTERFESDHTCTKGDKSVKHQFTILKVITHVQREIHLSSISYLFLKWIHIYKGG
jgi:hypothetical protein